MSLMPIGAELSYPGLRGIESWEIHDLTGIYPGYATLHCIGLESVPASNGDLVLKYDDSHVVTFKFMHVVSYNVDESTGGQTGQLTLQDERWAWEFFTICGNYNILKPSGLIDPVHQRTARQLAALCFEALHVERYDVSQLPNDGFPRADWDNVRADQALERLCDELGCRIVCRRSDATWRIVQSGIGDALPTGPLQSNGVGINPRPRPDFLRVVTAPVRIQVALQLLAAGRQTNLVWDDLQNLQYKPIRSTGLPDDQCGEFGLDWKMQSLVSNVRAVLPDGTARSPRELTLCDAFRAWRISDRPTNVSWFTDFNPFTGESANKFFLPGFGDYVTRKQLIITNELVQSYTDQLDEDHRRPAFIFGRYFSNVLGGNVQFGTRIDKQGARSQQDPEEPASFSMSINDRDTDLTIVTTSRPMMTFYQTNVNDLKSPFGVATLFLMTAVMVRNPTTWQPYRYEKLLQVGNGTDPTFCKTLIQEDIEPWMIVNYDSVGNPLPGNNFGRLGEFNAVDNINNLKIGNITNNQDEVDRMCNYYLQNYSQTLQVINGISRRYIGLLKIDLDGAIMQVSYMGGKQGFDTVASWNTEHKFDIPNFENRLKRSAYASKAAMVDYLEYRARRRERLLSESNTL